MSNRILSHKHLLQLKRWNTPTIYNGWEQITSRDPASECFNRHEVTDFMPQMGQMIGYAVTVKIEPSNPEHTQGNTKAWSEYRKYVASISAPTIAVVQDLDKPEVIGSFWGEVNANVHQALGCIGTITDGAIRDVDEMTYAGFKALAKRLCVGHAHAFPVEWNCEVEAFGTTIQPGQLIHADKHGFLVIPEEDQGKLLEAAEFMDANECETLISAARESTGKSMEQILEDLDNAGQKFKNNSKRKFSKGGEWS